MEGRQRHNERAMTRAQIDGERDGGRDKERWRFLRPLGKHGVRERERVGGEEEKGETLNE